MWQCPMRTIVTSRKGVRTPLRRGKSGQGHSAVGRSQRHLLPEARSHGGGDNDNDNDTLREVPHPSNEGLAPQARVSGS